MAFEFLAQKILVCDMHFYLNIHFHNKPELLWHLALAVIQIDFVSNWEISNEVQKLIWHLSVIHFQHRPVKFNHFLYDKFLELFLFSLLAAFLPEFHNFITIFIWFSRQMLRLFIFLRFSFLIRTFKSISWTVIPAGWWRFYLCSIENCKRCVKDLLLYELCRRKVATTKMRNK